MNELASGAADSIDDNGNWRQLSLLVIAALLVCAAAAWLGYRSHAEPRHDASPDPAQARDAKTAQPPFKPANRGLSANEEIVSGSATPQASSGPAWPMWEFRLRQPIPPRDPSLTPPTWRLIGSSLTGGKWSIIVLRQGSAAPEYFSVGQELPGGYRIESINEEDVTLAKGKRLMVLSYIGSR